MRACAVPHTYSQCHAAGVRARRQEDARRSWGGIEVDGNILERHVMNVSSLLRWDYWRGIHNDMRESHRNCCVWYSRCTEGLKALDRVRCRAWQRKQDFEIGEGKPGIHECQGHLDIMQGKYGNHWLTVMYINWIQISRCRCNVGLHWCALPYRWAFTGGRHIEICAVTWVHDCPSMTHRIC